MSIREMKLVLPKKGNDGRDLGKEHAYVCRALLTTFGGYTACDAFGAWEHPLTGKEHIEETRVYVFAGSDEYPFNRDDAARNIAAEFKRTAEQEAVYYVDTFGNVYFI